MAECLERRVKAEKVRRLFWRETSPTESAGVQPSALTGDHVHKRSIEALNTPIASGMHSGALAADDRQRRCDRVFVGCPVNLPEWPANFLRIRTAWSAVASVPQTRVCGTCPTPADY